MHWFDVAVLFVVLTLVGVEFSVSAFVNPAVWQLEPAPQLQALRHLARVLGTVMPVWYPAAGVLLAAETWLHWHTGARPLLLASVALWVLASLASIVALVPLNTRIAQGLPDWERTSRTWDRRHRVRIAALATAGVLAIAALVR